MTFLAPNRRVAAHGDVLVGRSIARGRSEMYVYRSKSGIGHSRELGDQTFAGIIVEIGAIVAKRSLKKLPHLENLNIF